MQSLNAGFWLHNVQRTELQIRNAALHACTTPAAYPANVQAIKALAIYLF